MSRLHCVLLTLTAAVLVGGCKTDIPIGYLTPVANEVVEPTATLPPEPGSDPPDSSLFSSGADASPTDASPTDASARAPTIPPAEGGVTDASLQAIGPRDAASVDSALSDAPPASDASPAPLRDALALFDFRTAAGPPYQDLKGDLSLDVPAGAEPGLLRATASGVEFQGATRLSSETTGELVEACKASGELTIEAWVSPSGPYQLRSRIVSSSASVNLRNFSLGVGPNDGTAGTGSCAEESLAVVGLGGGESSYFLRRRAPDSLNGYPELWTRRIVDGDLAHVVASQAADGTNRIYVDGQVEAECVHEATFDNWEPSFPLHIGGESGATDRSFTGTVHLVALYCRALTGPEVQRLFRAGI